MAMCYNTGGFRQAIPRTPNVKLSWPVSNLPLFGLLTSAFLCADGSATSKISTGGKAFMALLSGRAGGVSAMIGADFDGNGFVGIACCLEICGENLKWPE